MKIEVGKKYRDIDGDIMEVVYVGRGRVFAFYEASVGQTHSHNADLKYAKSRWRAVPPEPSSKP